MIRHTRPEADALSDDRLLTLIRDGIAKAQRRASCKPALRQLLAGALAEEKAEALVKSALTAEDIAAVCDATVEQALPRFPAAQIAGRSA